MMTFDNKYHYPQIKCLIFFSFRQATPEREKETHKDTDRAEVDK